jgi:hypothetical protein
VSVALERWRCGRTPRHPDLAEALASDRQVRRMDIPPCGADPSVSRNAAFSHPLPHRRVRAATPDEINTRPTILAKIDRCIEPLVRLQYDLTTFILLSRNVL